MLTFEPHPYQARAIEWVEERERSALFLDMGLGKTVITLTAIADLMDTADVTRALVIAPKKVAEGTWDGEAAKWRHTSRLRVIPIIGTGRQRMARLAEEADINVIGRDSLQWLWETLGPEAWPFDMVVMDELTTFKNPKSKRWKALKAISKLPGRMIGLTGTPAPNGLEDLWAQIWPLDFGERLGRTLTAYRMAYFNAYTIGGMVTKYSLRRGSEAIICSRLADLCLSMQAADYLTLPPKMEIDIKVEISPKERERYDQFEREMVLNFEDSVETTVMASSAAALMNKLTQYTSGAIYSDPPENTVWQCTTDAKIEHLAEIVEAAPGAVLVFYQYRHEVPRITSALRGLRVKKYESEADLRAWNDREIDVLLAHPASTAFGLNMQRGGSTIVWTSTGWNLELYQQACARLHRQGQTEPVRIYRLIVPGTVDERAAAAIASKASVQAGILGALSDLRRKYSG